jgi:Na+/melibiose symporter-like transporter
MTPEQHAANPVAGILHQLKVVLSCKNIWICSGLLFLVHLAPGFGTPLFYYKSEVLKFDEQFIGNLTVVGGVMGLVGALLYPLLCRKFHLRGLLYLSISSTVLSALCYLGYVSKSSAIVIEGVGILGYTLAQLPLFDLAARATPKGSEALGYAVMLALGNLSTSFSDVLGSLLFEKFKHVHESGLDQCRHHCAGSLRGPVPSRLSGGQERGRGYDVVALLTARKADV